MHIPENYLSPSTCAVMAVAALPVVYTCAKRIKHRVPPERIPLLGVGAALSFLLMMFNVPVPGGTSAHAVGGTLVAVLLGPEAAVLAVTAALVIQALFFGDGGLLAVGANVFNMAVLLPAVGYGVFRILRRYLPDSIAVGIGAYLGINAAAFLAALEFGIQPALFHDVAGQALYCPYPLSVSIPAMMIPHLTIAGLAEAILSMGIFAFVHKTEMKGLNFNEGFDVNHKALYALLIVLIILCPLGLLTEATAWGEWGTDEISDVVVNGQALGYVPSGMAEGWSWAAPFGDYGIPGLPDVTGYILSAIIGVAVLTIIFKIIAGIRRVS